MLEQHDAHPHGPSPQIAKVGFSRLVDEQICILRSFEYAISPTGYIT